MASNNSLHPICVLGMHRSGTSCLVGSLQDRGIYLGDVVTKSTHNAKGNREMVSLRKLNEHVLNHSGGSWNTLPARIRWTPEHTERRDILLQSFQHAKQRWGFKDPRTLGVLDFWLDSGETFQYVGSFRHPTAVAKSLTTRDPEMSIAKALDIWLQYNVKLIQVYEQNPFPLINFSLRDDEYTRQLDGVLTKLELTPLESTSSPGFFDKSLRHQSDEDLDEDALSNEHLEVFRILEHYSQQ